MEPIINSEEQTLGKLKERLANGGQIDKGERQLDCQAVDSLEMQIDLYRAGLVETHPQYARFMKKAREIGLRVLNQQRSGLEPADLVLRPRVAVNILYANFSLDNATEDDLELPRTRDFTRRWGTPGTFAAAFKCGRATRDPRVPHYFAEMAVLQPHSSFDYGRKPIIAVEAPGAHPVQTSARLLYFSKKLDGHEDTPIDSWHPKWLEGRIPQLDEAKEMIKRAEAEWDFAQVSKNGQVRPKGSRRKLQVVTGSGHKKGERQ
jgi:hypothetical protein